MCGYNYSYAREQKNRVVGVERLRADKAEWTPMGRIVGREGLKLQRRETLTQGQHLPSRRRLFSIADEQLSSSPVQLCKACSITKTSVSWGRGRLALIYCLSDLAVSQSSLPKPHGF